MMVMSRLDEPTGMRDDGYDDDTDENNDEKRREAMTRRRARRDNETIDNENETGRRDARTICGYDDEMSDGEGLIDE